jgi:uncharacterized protein
MAEPHTCRRRLRALHAQLQRQGTGSATPSRAEAAASAYADDSPHGEVHFVEVEPNVLLCANIYRPTSSDAHPVPVVLAYTPYRQPSVSNGDELQHQDRQSLTRQIDPLVRRGYACVTFDVRGTGNSSGHSSMIYSKEEQADGFAMIDWASRQPWCTGAVGMWGISFGGSVGLQQLGRRPPALKAVIVRSGTDDNYLEWTNPGGTPRPYQHTVFSSIMASANFSPPDPDAVGSRWADVWQERVERSRPWSLSFVENRLNTDFWRTRGLSHERAAEVNDCAVFVIGGWSDWYAHALLRVFGRVQGPRRGLIGPWSHDWPNNSVPGPRIDFTHEAARFFDEHLKGIVPPEEEANAPPLTIFRREFTPPASFRLEERGEFVTEEQWPPARVQPTTFHLQAGGSLSLSGPDPGAEADEVRYDPRVGRCAGMWGGGPTVPSWSLPLDQRLDEALSLCYTTEAFEDGIVLGGKPVAELWVSTTAAKTATIALKLSDVNPVTGVSSLITKSSLNLSHRHSHVTPSPLPKHNGEVMRVVIELLDCSYRVLPGHRLRLAVSGGCLLNLWPSPEPAVHTIHRGEQYPSVLVLPVLPPPAVTAPRPTVRLLPPADAGDFVAPKFWIEEDLIEERSTVCFQGANHANPMEFRMTVSHREPAVATVDSRMTRTMQYLGQTFEVDARCVTASDRHSFHHTVDVEASIGGKQHWQKHWATSSPRALD